MTNPDPSLFQSHQDLCPLDTIKDVHFTIVGCGSLGTVMSRILARLGACRFHLIDGGTVEPHHLNREVFGHDQVGLNKAAALSYQLTNIHRKVRCVTTGKSFDPDHLQRGKENVVYMVSSDLGLPAKAIAAVRDWDAEQRPRVVVARHTSLLGGYWMSDLTTEPDAVMPPEVPWFIETGREAADANARIATTAHVVAGVTVQATIDALQGKQVRPRVDLDLGRLLYA